MILHLHRVLVDRVLRFGLAGNTVSAHQSPPFGDELLIRGDCGL